MQYKNEYLDYLGAKGFAEKTLQYKELYLDQYFFYVQDSGIEDIHDVTPSHIERYRAHVGKYCNRRTGKKLSMLTVFAKLNVVKGYFSFLTRTRRIFINPAEQLHLPKQPDSIPRNILSEKEIETLLALPDTTMPAGVRDRAILELLYSTGIRRQELVNLNLYDIDLQKRTLRVYKGKNRKDRVMPVGRVACRVVHAYIKTVRHISLHPYRRFKKINRYGEQALFVSQFGRRIKAHSLNYIIKRYMRQIYPSRNISCHSFRHSCATHMLRGGAHIRAIQKMLGHSSLASTQVYTRVAPVDVKEAHRRCHPRG